MRLCLVLSVVLLLPHSLMAQVGWWNVADRPASPLALEVQGTSLFLGWYTYDDLGRATWLAAQLEQKPDGSYQGDALQCTGWPLEDGVPGSVTVESVGTITLTLQGASSGTILFDTGPAAISSAITPLLLGEANYPDLNGWWYDAAYTGTGWFVEARDGIVLLSFCHYRDDGSSRWYVAMGALPPTGQTVSLDLMEFAGGPPLSGGGALPTASVLGKAVMTTQGTTPDSLSVTLLGITYHLTRSVFGGSALTFPVVDTGQTTYYADTYPILIEPPGPGEAFYGQDAQCQGLQPAYKDNGDGTVTDLNTGLVWQQSPDLDGNGVITAADKLTYDQALDYAQSLKLAGHSDWRLPTIKELYSLILFSGIDPSGYEGTDTDGLTPFIDTDAFAFAYGDTSAGERIIDAQYASSTLYVSNTANDGGRTMFGVNFADGRIKGYGLNIGGNDKTFHVLCVRGDTYGLNDFRDNGDGTITDLATGLMWSQADSGTGMKWEDALAWAEQKNRENHLGHDDWRLPNAKELQSIVDYARSPDTTDSPAIDPLFSVSPIVNEAGQPDFPYFWSSTTHATWSERSGAFAAYVAFGRALGYLGGWKDVHGAGAQRSDPKAGNSGDYPFGHGPQGDAVRILNYVRLVRDAG